MVLQSCQTCRWRHTDIFSFDMVCHVTTKVATCKDPNLTLNFRPFFYMKQKIGEEKKASSDLIYKLNALEHSSAASEKKNTQSTFITADITYLFTLFIWILGCSIFTLWRNTSLTSVLQILYVRRCLVWILSKYRNDNRIIQCLFTEDALAYG